MTQSIFKYPVPIEDEFEIEMPAAVKSDAAVKVLHVAVQDGKPYIWVLVKQTGQPMMRRQFSLRGTGHSCDGLNPDGPHQNCTFIGTFFMHGGALVFHLFDRGFA